MIEVHFDFNSYSYNIFKFIYTNGRKTHYVDSNWDIHSINEGQNIEPHMTLSGDMYEELKQHFLTEHEQPLEAKQAVIDELRDSLRIERIRVDQLLTKVLE